jgi:hypothetical protein
MFKTLSEILYDFDPDMPGLHALATLGVDLSCICDVRSNPEDPDLPYVKWNPEKCMNWLKLKVEYLASVVVKMQLFSDYQFQSRSTFL